MTIKLQPTANITDITAAARAVVEIVLSVPNEHREATMALTMIALRKVEGLVRHQLIGCNHEPPPCCPESDGQSSTRNSFKIMLVQTATILITSLLLLSDLG
jgi:hypothetical protein